MESIMELPVEHKSVEIKSKVKDYWSVRAEGFADLREAEIESNKYFKWEKELLQQLPTEPGLKILDAGCGCGFFGIILSRHGYHVTGIDLTPAMIEKGNQLKKHHACQMELLVMDAEWLEFEDNSFDVVLSRNLTWTLPHPEKAYKEWKRVLKPGGVLLNYDAEYAKNHCNYQNLPKEHAHNRISPIIKDQCEQIYQMMKLSNRKRPDWDREILTQLGMVVEHIDEQVGRRIYAEKDQFYIPEPMFGVKAYK